MGKEVGLSRERETVIVAESGYPVDPHRYERVSGRSISHQVSTTIGRLWRPGSNAWSVVLPRKGASTT